MAPTIRTRPLSRRTLLRGLGGTAMALPWLEAMASPAGPAASPHRMVCVGLAYGFVPDMFFPTETGINYTLSPLLKNLSHLKDDFTVISGLDHGENGIGGHDGTHAFLSGIMSGNSKSFKNRNVTLDQVAAASVGAGTRYPSLQFSPETQNNWKMSWTPSGVGIMPMGSLSDIYNLLFKQEATNNIENNSLRFGHRLSVLDVVREDAKRLQGQLGATDRERLDQYFTSIRSLEKSIAQSEAWLHIPKPETNYEMPYNPDALTYKEKLPIFYELMALALETDQTRVLSLELSELGHSLGGFKISSIYHLLSHHGKVESTLKELNIVETFQMQAFGKFLERLKSVTEPNGQTLLDTTMCLIGSGMGNASSHSNKRLPLLLAGGGFKHGQHLSFANENKHIPATNLYLSMLNRFGLEIDEFNLSTGTLTGLEFA